MGLGEGMPAFCVPPGSPAGATRPAHLCGLPRALGSALSLSPAGHQAADLGPSGILVSTSFLFSVTSSSGSLLPSRLLHVLLSAAGGSYGDPSAVPGPAQNLQAHVPAVALVCLTSPPPGFLQAPICPHHSSPYHLPIRPNSPPAGCSDHVG